MYLAKDKDHARSVALGKHGAHTYIRVYDISIVKMRDVFRAMSFSLAIL